MSDEALPPPPSIELAEPPDAGPPPPPPLSPPPPLPPPPPPVLFRADAWKPRPLLGPTLWAYGVGLWAFVVLGQFTTKYAPWSSTVPLGGVPAALGLFAISLAAVAHALRTSFALPNESWSRGKRIAFVSIAAPVLWLFTGLLSAMVGSRTRSFDVFMTLALLALAITTTVLGRASTRALSPPPQGPALVLLFALWATGAVFSLMAVLQLG